MKAQERLRKGPNTKALMADPTTSQGQLIFLRCLAACGADVAVDGIAPKTRAVWLVIESNGRRMRGSLAITGQFTITYKVAL